jgi:prepilin-type N-terminal cleavage/methylation domain-containing protein
MNKTKNAFTLIELLVVIAIIAILAAILFPVFAQAKAAAKKAVTLSNLKQLGTAAYLYANDYDDQLGDTPCDNEQGDNYVLAVRMEPYIKANGLWINMQSPYKDGAVAHGEVDLPEAVGATVYMKAPNDPCVGVGTSVYPTGTGYAYINGTANTDSNYYSDIYPPVDFELNANMWGYTENGCPTNGLTQGYSHPGPNISSGVQGGSGQNGTGQAPPTFTSVAKAILMIDAPGDNQYYDPNPYNATDYSLVAGLWGVNYQGFDGQGNNAVFFDSHAKFYNHNALIPNGWVEAEDDWLCYQCGSQAQYMDQQQLNWAGQAWIFWGTSYASPSNQ